MTLPGKDEPIPSKGNDDNLEDQEGEETFGVTISRRVGFVKGLYISTLSLIGG
jgi:hypothetical protein